MSVVVSKIYKTEHTELTNLWGLTPVALRPGRKVGEGTLRKREFLRFKISCPESTYNFARPFAIRLLVASPVVPFAAESYTDFGCLLVTI